MSPCLTRQPCYSTPGNLQCIYLLSPISPCPTRHPQYLTRGNIPMSLLIKSHVTLLNKTHLILHTRQFTSVPTYWVSFHPVQQDALNTPHQEIYQCPYLLSPMWPCPTGHPKYTTPGNIPGSLLIESHVTRFNKTPSILHTRQYTSVPTYWVPCHPVKQDTVNTPHQAMYQCPYLLSHMSPCPTGHPQYRTPGNIPVSLLF